MALSRTAFDRLPSESLHERLRVAVERGVCVGIYGDITGCERIDRDRNTEDLEISCPSDGERNGKDHGESNSN